MTDNDRISVGSDDDYVVQLKTQRQKTTVKTIN